MSTEYSIHYVVYDLVTYFSRQPGFMRHCPDCGDSLSISKVEPSQAVANALLHSALIPVHGFSYLYECRTCPWCAVRESWTYCESGSTADYLIVRSAAGIQEMLNKSDWQALLNRELEENEHIYDSTLPLREALGQLFFVR